MILSKASRILQHFPSSVNKELNWTAKVSEKRKKWEKKEWNRQKNWRGRRVNAGRAELAFFVRHHLTITTHRFMSSRGKTISLSHISRKIVLVILFHWGRLWNPTLGIGDALILSWTGSESVIGLPQFTNNLIHFYNKKYSRLVIVVVFYSWIWEDKNIYRFFSGNTIVCKMLFILLWEKENRSRRIITLRHGFRCTKWTFNSDLFFKTLL